MRTRGEHLTADRDDHCVHFCTKSLPYLVSNAFEEDYHPLKWGWPGAPLLGITDRAVCKVREPVPFSAETS